MYRVGMFSLITCFVLMAVCVAEPSVKSDNSTVGSELTLVKNGRPTATIVISESPADNARTAANELRKYIEKISGAKLPITTDSVPVSGSVVLVGKSNLTDGIPNLRIPSGRTKNLCEEGFVIRTHGNRLVLAGNDAEPYLGTRYAVIEFLHRLGVRWFMPGEMGEVIPKMATIAVSRDPEPEYSISNEWFYFVNRILAEVNKEFPDHIIATNGYANRDIPPEMPPEIQFNPAQNLTIMFANIAACTIHAYDDPKCWQMHRQGQMIRQWCKLSDKVWIYNYNYTMLVHKGTITPMVHRIRRNIPLLKKWGVIGFFDQDEADFALSGIPTRLVRARLEWDVETGVDAVLDDFFDKWFGQAALPMKAYYDALEDAFQKAPQHGHEDVILRSIYSEFLMSKLDSLMRGAESVAKSEEEKAHVRIERVIYDNLCEFVAMEEAKRTCNFAKAADHAGKMVELQEELNKISPFMGWHPYAVYGCKWEKKRMEKALAKTHGPEGELVVQLPEIARFRTDPFDDGLYERWQDLPAEGASWQDIKISSGWDSQGLHDDKGHPYKGIAWYQFDVDVSAETQADNVFLHGLAVVNEAWVWINGRYAGHRPYKMPWFRPHSLELDVSGLLKPGQKSSATIRVLCNFDVFGANGIYEPMFLYAKKPSERTSSK